MKLTPSKQWLDPTGMNSAAHGIPSVTYEDRLSEKREWALSEGSRFFEGKSSLQEALRKITARLDEIDVPYAVVGGLALFQYGYRRFTEDVDLLVSAASLGKIHQQLDGLGYVPPFPGSKHLRDTELGVRIEFLIEGQFPGDGKPKPVSFPNPELVAENHGGVKYLQLPRLVELKLASGMTSPGRLKDLSDVVELIKLLALPLAFAQQLNEYVRPKYQELWNSVRGTSTRYVMRLSNPSLTEKAKSLDEMIQLSPAEANKTLRAMQADGVVLDAGRNPTDGHLYLVTTEPDVARKYGMHEESEYWNAGDNPK